MRIAVVRGAFANPYELQNFAPLARRHEVVVFGSKTADIAPVELPLVKLGSPYDWGARRGRIVRGLLNRAMTDAHYLFGLPEKLRGFDVAHCAETYYHYTQQCLDAKRRGFVKRVVATVWENIPFNNEGIRGRREFKKRALAEVDHFLAVTRGAREALMAEGCDPAKITVVPMGVDLTKFRSGRSDQEDRGDRKNRGRKRTTVLFVGRLVEEKGVRELAEAIREMGPSSPRYLSGLRRGKGVAFRIIGEGPLKHLFAGLENVRVESRLYEQMPQVYREADVFVLPAKPTPAWQEQYGMVLVEAMASGLPIVATRTGAIPEVVGKAAILVEPGSAESLREGLVRAIGKIRDIGGRERRAQEARQRAEKFFNAEKTAKKIEGLYKRV